MCDDEQRALDGVKLVPEIFEMRTANGFKLWILAEPCVKGELLCVVYGVLQLGALCPELLD